VRIGGPSQAFRRCSTTRQQMALRRGKFDQSVIGICDHPDRP